MNLFKKKIVLKLTYVHIYSINQGEPIRFFIGISMNVFARSSTCIAVEILEATKPKSSPKVPERINARLGEEWQLIWDVLRKCYPRKTDSQLVREGLRALAAIHLTEVQGHVAEVFIEIKPADSELKRINLILFLGI